MGKQTRKLLTGQGKVLSFDQPGDFFLRAGMRAQEQNNLTEAAAAYREAMRKEPENTECRLALAEVLTQMGRFDESNQLLFNLAQSEEAPPSECLFGLACNLIGLQEYPLAHDMLEQYLNVDPEGEFADDALDMLDALEEQRLAQEMEMPDRQLIQEACEKSKAFMEQGDAERAQKVLEFALEQFPDDLDLLNYQALARFCGRDFPQAVKLTRQVLQRFPDNLQAKCNLALFLNAQGEAEQARAAAQELRSLRPDDPDELNRLALTMMEAGFLEDAYQLYQKLHRAAPYDVNITHRFAVCCYEMGRYKQAMTLYDRLRRVDSTDSVARYLRGVCAAAAAGGPHPEQLPYLYQVPNDVMVERVRQINDSVHQSRETLEQRWQEDEAFRSLVLWALQLTDTDIKRAMLTLVGSFHDRQAEEVLRGFLLERSQPDDLKQEAFCLLARNGAKEPYTAYLAGQLVQTRVNYGAATPQELGEDNPYQKVLHESYVALLEEGEPASAKAAFDLFWAYYLGMGKELPSLRESQVAPMAAALVYLGRRQAEAPVNKSTLCSSYKVSLLRLNAAIGKILAGAKRGKEQYSQFLDQEETKLEKPEETPPCE